MTIQQKIKSACAIAGMNESRLAENLGTSKSAFNQRMKRGKFSPEELEDIARAMGAELVLKFRFKDGTEI